jgi:type I restriction enzyme S subunit
MRNDVDPALGGKTVSEWREVRLGQLCDCITVGHVGKMSDQYIDAGVPFLRSQDVAPFRLNIDGSLRVSRAFHQRLKKSALRPGDVVVVRTGYPGTAAVVPDGTSELNCADLVVIRPGPELDPWFVASYFNSTHGRSMVGGRLVGAAQQHFNVRVAADVWLLLPPLPGQHRITTVVKGLTELIEINERRIELLEDLARSLYREWFVRFRFPGHDEGDLIDSELGLLPKGWSICAMREIAGVDKGLSYKGQHLTDTGTPMANLKCISPFGGFRRGGTKPYSGGYKPKHAIVAGDLLVANTDLTQAGHVIGAPAIVPFAGFTDGGLISHYLFVVRPRNGATETSYLFQLLADERFRAFARGRASGTTVLGFRADDFLSYEFIAPPLELRRLFSEQVAQMRDLADKLLDQNSALAATRDLLLPRLVTGRLDISDIDLDELLPAGVA